MTLQTYKRVANLSFAVGTVAVLLFDSFRNPLIPGSVLLAAGLVALGTHICARYRIHPGTEGSDSLPKAVSHETSATADVPIDKAKQRIALNYTATMQKELTELAGLTVDSPFMEGFTFRRQMVHFIARPRRVGPGWQTVETAIAVAKALSSEPTSYEVILTSDGAIKIRPLSRVPEAQLFEEPRRYRGSPAGASESKYVQ